jgi:hypothetical protein
MEPARAIDTLRQAGVAIARTLDGVDLPIIDITHPRFAVADDPASIDALRAFAVRSEAEHRRMPQFILRWMLRAAAQESLLMRAMFGSDASFLDSISTYVMKLGAGNLLPPYDSPTDRRFSASSYPIVLRLRMQQMAKLIAAGVADALAAGPQRPLHVINIAGGPAMDAINALLLLVQSSPALLRRPVVIHVLDLDEAGPFFGRAALAELQRQGGKLSGLDITFRHQPYDWRVTEPLGALIDALHAQDAIVIAASEGGLFEYGNDADVVANLRILSAGGRDVSCVVGSVTRADQMMRRLIAQTPLQLVPRGLDGFAPLAARAGFTIADARPAIWSDLVALRSDPSLHA